MSQTIAQAGTFRGRILSYGIYESQSGAVAVNIEVLIDDCFDPDNTEWVDWKEFAVHAFGSVWVVKRDGQLNESQVRALVDHAGWDGDFTTIVAGTWKPTPIQIEVGEDEYDGEVRYRIEWVRGYDQDPGAVGNVNAESAKAMQDKYGSQLRALVGNTKRQDAPKSKPKGRPKGSKSKGKPAEPTAEPEKGTAPPVEDEIPF